MMENVEEIETLLSRNWPHVFSSFDANTSITLTKVSSHNWLIKCSSDLSYVLKCCERSDLDFELKYLSDLNEYLHGEYRVPLPICTLKGDRHVDGRYWLYEYLLGHVYEDSTCEHFFEENQLVLLAHLICRYHQFLITNSATLSTTKKSRTRQHLLDEFQQSVVRALFSRVHLRFCRSCRTT